MAKTAAQRTSRGEASSHGWVIADDIPKFLAAVARQGRVPHE